MAGLPKCVEGAGQKEVHVPMSGAAGGNSNGRVDVDSDMQDATSDVSQLSEAAGVLSLAPPFSMCAAAPAGDCAAEAAP